MSSQRGHLTDLLPLAVGSCESEMAANIYPKKLMKYDGRKTKTRMEDPGTDRAGAEQAGGGSAVCM